MPLKNNCKISSLAILLIMLTFGVHAQIQVGGGEALGGTYGMAKKIKKSEMDLFKKSTLIITIPNKDSNQIEYYKEVLQKVWKITPFEVITISKINEYANKPNYSFATIGGMAFNIGAGNDKYGFDRAVASFIYDYEIWMPVPGKLMNVKERHVFARIILKPDIKTSVMGANKAYNESTWGRVRFGQGPAARLYETAYFYNFGYGFFKGFFKIINDKLEAEETCTFQYIKETDQSATLLKKIESDTLFALEVAQKTIYVSAKTKNMMSPKAIAEAEEKANEDIEDVQIRKGFVVKYLTPEVMNERIRTTQKPFYYFSYTETDNGKYVIVFDALSGNIAFQRHDLIMAVEKNAPFYFKKIEQELK